MSIKSHFHGFLSIIMPELPEVETTVRALRKYVVGKTVIGVWTNPKKTIAARGPETWHSIKKVVQSKKIIAVRRRAKYIIIDLAENLSLFIHQKMSGHLLYGRWKKINNIWLSRNDEVMQDPKNQHIRFVACLNNRHQIALSDQRRFGTITLVRNGDMSRIPELKNLGPEPLEIKYPQFKELFLKKRGVLKPTLMDPHFVAGIGNIYADEILWHAGLAPHSRVECLNAGDIKKIFRYTRQVLTKAILYKGSSVNNYRIPSGQSGRYQMIHRAYQRHNTKCLKNDGGTLIKTAIGQRSAHFCPVHQVNRT